MQLNCLVFPSPKNVDVRELKSQIILVPKVEGMQEISYQDYLAPHRTKLANEDSSTFRVGKAEHILSKGSMATQPSEQSQREDSPLIARSFTPTTPKELSTREATPLSYQFLLPITKTHESDTSVPVHGYIPCLYLQGNTKRVIVFFHGNAEDLQSSSSFVTYLQSRTGYTVLAMEFEGYSIYAGSPSAESVQRDALRIIQHLATNKGFEYHNIIVLGRSIGSGPAIFAAAHFKVGALVLISPFLSICKLVEDKYGWLCSMLLQERFSNQELIAHVQSPILIIHGLEDKIIPYHHSTGLQRRARSYCKVKLAEGMSHSQFGFMEDFIRPLRKFLESIGY